MSTKKIIAVVAIAAVSLASSIAAGEDARAPFGKGGFIGTFATARAEELDSFDQIAAEHEAGAGIELGYSFSRNFSLAFEIHGQARAIKSDFLNEAGLTAAWGIPFGNVKPFASAGVGYEILNQTLDLNTYAGAGVEVAVSAKVKGFLEYRKFITGKDDHLLRLGIRRSF